MVVDNATRTRSRSPTGGAMIQRPVAQPLSEGSMTSTPTPGRGRLSSRRAAGCAAIACIFAFGGIFFLAEIRTTPSSDIGSAGGEMGVLISLDLHDTAKEEVVWGIVEVDQVDSGFRRYESFEEHVNASRRNGSSPLPLPVIQKGNNYATIPSLFIVGAERAGTTSLFKMLGQHPDVASLLPDDSEGFMLQDLETYPKDAEWPGDRLEQELPAKALGRFFDAYARPFTLADLREPGNETQLIAMENQPRYFAFPLAPHRLQLAFPYAKIVIILRDPVDRYYSEMREALCVDEDRIDWGDLENSFAMPNAPKEYLSTAVLNYSPYDKTCLGVGASAAHLWNCKLAAEKTHRPLLKGLYEEHVNRWLRAFKDRKHQIKIVSSTEMFAKPEKVAANVADFAGLSPHAFVEFATDRNAACDPRRKSKTVASAYAKRAELEQMLREWFADHNHMLFEDLARDYGWNERIQPLVPQSQGGDENDR